jgi:hypothetical protein
MALRTITGLTALLAFGVAAPALAQIPANPLIEDVSAGNQRYGTRGAAFLEIGLGARASALAGSVTADVEGIPALYWNTAGIARHESARFGFTHSGLFEGFDLSIGQIAGILPMGGGAVGLSLTFFSSGEIERTTVDYPEGGDPLRGEFFHYRATAASLHYARPVTDRLALGGAVRYAQEGFEGASANFAGLDIGTQFATGLYGVVLGAAISNIGTDGQFRGTAMRYRLTEGIPTGASVVDLQATASQAAMPMSFRFSIATDLLGGADALIRPDPQHNLRLLGGVSDAIGSNIQGTVGVEYGFRELVFLRGGKRFLNEGEVAPWGGDAGLGVGGGLRLPLGRSRLTFDYAYQPWGELNSLQMFSLEFAF